MLQSIKKSSLLSVTLFIGLFFSIFLFIWLWYNPSLVYSIPKTYLLQELKIPNSHLLAAPPVTPLQLINPLAGAIHHLFYYSVLASIIITLFIALFFLLSRAFIRAFKTDRIFNILSFLPVLIIFYNIKKYEFSFWDWLPILLALLLFYIYRIFHYNRKFVKIALYLAFSTFIFFFDLNIYILFLLFCSCLEIFNSKKYYLPLVYLSISALIPLIYSQIFNHIGLLNLYKRFFDFTFIYNSSTLWVYLFFILTALFLGIVSNKPNLEKLKLYKILLKLDGIHLGAKFLIIITISGLTIFFTNDDNLRNNLLLRYYDTTDQWDKTLDLAKELPKNPNDLVQTHLIFRALLHKGLVLNNMLSYNCTRRGALFELPPNSTDNQLIDYWTWSSKTLFETGEINKVDNNMHEALTQLYYYPEGLKLMAKVNIIKGYPEMARVYLNILKEDFIYKNWAQGYLDRLDKDSDLKDDYELNTIRALIPNLKADSLSTSQDTLKLTYNKLTFEHSIAIKLLSKNLKSIAQNLGDFRTFSYAELPTTVEEALYVYYRISKEPFDKWGYSLSRTTIEKYKGFENIFQRAGGTLESARPYLKEAYGDTYFYYYLYAK